MLKCRACRWLVANAVLQMYLYDSPEMSGSPSSGMATEVGFAECAGFNNCSRQMPVVCLSETCCVMSDGNGPTLAGCCIQLCLLQTGVPLPDASPPYQYS